MIITHKTKLKEIVNILPIAQLAGTDLLLECSKFAMPKEIQGIKPMKHSAITILQQSWIWDIKDTKDLLLAYVEIFFGVKEKQEEWLKKSPLIDFYRFAWEVKEQSLRYADAFAEIKVELTEDEKKAGFGDKDENGLTNMVLSMSNKKGISMKDAWDYPLVEYIYTFQHDAKESNRQRKYNKIISEKK
ncbi:MAG TPA: hypothetical protein DCS19_07910 [Flavobacterium sp.]|nr:hypothetical protein [Flavobacterium sp.]